MSDIMQDYFEYAHSSLLSEEDLINCVRGLPALLFRIEMVKNKIEYLNDFQVEGLGEKTFLLLKNRQLSREIVLEQDFYLYESFIQSVHSARTVITVIRTKDEAGHIHWIKLIGSPNRYHSGFYLGMLEDITPSVVLIEDMSQKDDERQTMLEMVDNPVMLVDWSDKKIVSHNVAAQELFGYNFEEFRKLKLNDLYDQSYKAEMDKIYEDIIFQKTWNGKMLFRRKNQSSILGKVTLRSLKIREKRLLRISVYKVDMVHNFSTSDTAPSNLMQMSDSRKKYIQMLLNKIENVSDIFKTLEILLHNPFKDQEYDGLMYSDIQVKKSKVVVYAAGEAFNNLKSGESFSYEGTIAENIEQYKLDHLIVDDTMSSIKAIDWALFIPYGIRSYFAKPFYERNTLRSVLILCSKKVNAFSEEKLDDYTLLCDPFSKGLKNWRKALRRRNNQIK